MTDQLKIVLDPSAAQNWVEIDAIKLTGRTRPKGNLRSIVFWTDKNNANFASDFMKDT